jgi:hypothetical protein
MLHFFLKKKLLCVKDLKSNVNLFWDTSNTFYVRLCVRPANLTKLRFTNKKTPHKREVFF